MRSLGSTAALQERVAGPAPCSSAVSGARRGRAGSHLQHGERGGVLQDPRPLQHDNLLRHSHVVQQGPDL